MQIKLAFSAILNFTLLVKADSIPGPLFSAKRKSEPAGAPVDRFLAPSAASTTTQPLADSDAGKRIIDIFRNIIPNISQLNLKQSMETCLDQEVTQRWKVGANTVSLSHFQSKLSHDAFEVAEFASIINGPEVFSAIITSTEPSDLKITLDCDWSHITFSLQLTSPDNTSRDESKRTNDSTSIDRVTSRASINNVMGRKHGDTIIQKIILGTEEASRWLQSVTSELPQEAIDYLKARKWKQLLCLKANEKELTIWAPKSQDEVKLGIKIHFMKDTTIVHNIQTTFHEWLQRLAPLTARLEFRENFLTHRTDNMKESGIDEQQDMSELEFCDYIFSPEYDWTNPLASFNFFRGEMHSVEVTVSHKVRKDYAVEMKFDRSTVIYSLHSDPGKKDELPSTSPGKKDELPPTSSVTPDDPTELVKYPEQKNATKSDASTNPNNVTVKSFRNSLVRVLGRAAAQSFDAAILAQSLLGQKLLEKPMIPNATPSIEAIEEYLTKYNGSLIVMVAPNREMKLYYTNPKIDTDATKELQIKFSEDDIVYMQLVDRITPPAPSP